MLLALKGDDVVTLDTRQMAVFFNRPGSTTHVHNYNYRTKNLGIKNIGNDTVSSRTCFGGRLPSSGSDTNI